MGSDLYEVYEVYEVYGMRSRNMESVQGKYQVDRYFTLVESCCRGGDTYVGT